MKPHYSFGVFFSATFIFPVYVLILFTHSFYTDFAERCATLENKKYVLLSQLIPYDKNNLFPSCKKPRLSKT